MFKMRYLLPVAALAAILGYAVPSSAETIIDEWASVKAPPPPELKSATLDPKTTALVVIDIIKQTCNEQRRPRCVAAVQFVISRARSTDVFVCASWARTACHLERHASFWQISRKGRIA